MTPRYPWRRRNTIRETILPLLWFIPITLITAIALAGLIPTANAQPTTGERFADQHGVVLCMILDEHPDLPGVLGVGLALQANGFGAWDAGAALGLSVYRLCPVYEPLLTDLAIFGKQLNPPKWWVIA